MNYTGKKVLVTGGLGFIGSNLACRLAEAGAKVVVLDSSVQGCGANRRNLAGYDIPVIDDDIGNAARHAERLRGLEAVFNMAGEISHINSMRDPLRDLELNTTAQLRFLLALRAMQPGVRVVYASTRQVYGVPQFLPITESHPVNPIDFNGVHKNAAASYHRLLNASGDVDATILRLTNVYGPRMALNIPEQGVLGHFFRRALNGEPIEIFGHGEQQRDPVYIDDVVDACLLCASRHRLPHANLNVGGPEALPLAEIAGALAAAGGCEIRFRDFPEGHKSIDIGSYSTDSSRIAATIGWKPVTLFPAGVAKTLEYYREHRSHYLPS
ncbi:MAG: NAD-dependent epimerase/dehydratase family protein [Acidobacteria bacterium]|nr:NAD-dependent epimerase/dehydratase family protein [Acidobacteriota bacterium]